MTMYGPSDDEEEAYRQGFIHYHVEEIVEHMEQMAIGPDASDYGPSDDENQRAVRSNSDDGPSDDEYQRAVRPNSTAVCNCAEGRSSYENNASQQHSEYNIADGCGRSERSIESCR